MTVIWFAVLSIVFLGLLLAGIIWAPTVTLIALLAILAVEILARAALWRRAPEDDTRLPGVRLDFSPGGLGDLTPNQNGVLFSPSRSYNIQINAAGFRHADELRTDADTFRILAIGDSFALSPYLPNEDTWPFWLENMLAWRLYPEMSVQVLNAGMGGYTVEDELDYLVDKGLRLEPDLVIMEIHPGDVPDYLPRKRAQYQRRRIAARSAAAPKTSLARLAAGVRALLREHSALYALFHLLREAAQSKKKLMAQTGEVTSGRRGLEVAHWAPDAPENRVFWQSCEDDLRKTIRLLDEAGIPFLIVIIPGYSQIPENAYPAIFQQFVACIAADTGTPYVDLLPIFKRKGSIETLYLLRYDPTLPLDENNPLWPARSRYKGNGHLSRYGNEILAEAVAEWIVARGLLTPSPPACRMETGPQGGK
jgi:lysophospholipase L1-like esterase